MIQRWQKLDSVVISWFQDTAIPHLASVWVVLLEFLLYSDMNNFMNVSQ